jgi:aspartate aminotransferase
MWIISDEAYRELFYTEDSAVSVWRLNEKEVSGITGRRISIETASKVWNACGLRIGAIVTDNEEFNDRAIAENTANLCPNVTGQYIFGSLAHESKENLQKWYSKQREYYKNMMFDLNKRLEDLLPGVIISAPDSSIYSVVDFRNIAPKDFDTADFVKFCASEGKVSVKGSNGNGANGKVEDYTLLSSPMAGFYSVQEGRSNPGKTQVRLAYVETPDKIKLIPELMKELFEKYVE